MVIGKGNRRAQQKRRRNNNKGVTVLDKEYKLIDGNYSNRPYAYCKHYKAYLTKNMVYLHSCEKKNCKKLNILAHNISADKGEKDDK